MDRINGIKIKKTKTGMHRMKEIKEMKKHPVHPCKLAWITICH